MARKIKRIAVHHSASDAKKTTVEDIRKWHKARGFQDIGYHYLIGYDGQIHVGRPEDQVGAHVEGWNKDSIGICVIGNTSVMPPSESQLVNLEVLLDHLLDKYGLTRKDVAGHRDFQGAATECPGNHLHRWLWNWIRDED